MPCEDLSNLEEKDYNYKSYFNFITLLTVIVGNSDFILKEMGIPLSYVKRKGQIDVKHKGITFVGKSNEGHFHFKSKTGKVTESYSEEWQRPGSNGLCQTFAIMGFLGKTDKFEKKEYLKNSIEALKFIKTKAKIIQKYWKETSESNYKKIAFDYPDYSATDIRQDIDCVVKNEYFFNKWLTEENVFN